MSGAVPVSGCGCLLKLCSRILLQSSPNVFSLWDSEGVTVWNMISLWWKAEGRIGRNLQCPCSLCFKVEANHFVIWLTASPVAKNNISGAETTLRMCIFPDNFKIHHTHGCWLLLFCGLCEFIAWSQSVMPFRLKLSLSFRGSSERNQGGYYNNLLII